MLFKVYSVRADLEFFKTIENGKLKHFIKDPITGTFYAMKFLQYEILKFFHGTKQSPEHCSELMAQKHDVEISPEQIQVFLENSKNKVFLKINQYYHLAPKGVVVVRSKFKEYLIETLKKRWGKHPPSKIESEVFAEVMELSYKYQLFEALRRLDKNKAESQSIAEAHQKLHELIILELKEQSSEKSILTSLVLNEYKSFDPTPVLNFLMPIFNIFFSKYGLIVIFSLLSAAIYSIFAIGTICLLCFEQNMILAARAYLFFILLMPIHLTIHEFGHAIVCRYFGGKVSKMGVLVFYGFMPTVFADTTDSYRMKKYQRIFVSMAGAAFQAVVSILLSIVIIFVDSKSYLFLLLWANLMMGIGSVIGNYLPGMKNDGYYILTDLIGVDNLFERSIKYCAHQLKSLFFVLDERAPEKPIRRERFWLWFFFLFVFGQFLFMTLLSLSMITFSWKHMFILPKILLFLLLIRGLFSLFSRLSFSGRPEWMSYLFRFKKSWALPIILFILFIPVRRHISVQGTVSPQNNTPVFAEIEGEVSKIYPRNFAEVKRGSLLFELRSKEITKAYQKSLWRYLSVKYQLEELENGLNPLETRSISSNIHREETVLSNLKQKLMRYESAFKSGTISPLELSALQNEFNIQSAKISLEKASYLAKISNSSDSFILRQDLDIAWLDLIHNEQNLKKLFIYAPHDGIVYFDQPGQSLKGQHVLVGQNLMTLKSKNTHIVTYISEKDVYQLEHIKKTQMILSTGVKLNLKIHALNPSVSKPGIRPNFSNFETTPNTYKATFLEDSSEDIYIGQSGPMKIYTGYQPFVFSIGRLLFNNFAVTFWKIF